ncbi:MAG TPA: sugar phosphate isomerase/epimerase family protein [Terriglobales bacterium]|nr:sugar phosphate isomerase/epimerase family protein [Terriglobales bacterium]
MPTFRLSVLSDEISQDFGRACEVARCHFGMNLVELRSLWDKNIVALDETEIVAAARLMKRYDLKVNGIAGPLFKVDWPGAPIPTHNEHRDHFNASYTFAQQDEVLERSIALAKILGASTVRCFDFWRLDDQGPYREAMNQALREAAEKIGRQGITLVLENEHACNTATGAEAASVLAEVRSRHLMLNWDPGNAAMAGEAPYPSGYDLLPKDRIGLCHCKDVGWNGGKREWAAVGEGMIDWPGQFRALKRDGYHGVISLETHWRGAGAPEASSIQSWKGMRSALAEAEVA